MGNFSASPATARREVFLSDEREHGACVLDGKTVLIEEDLLFSPTARDDIISPSPMNAHQILKTLYPACYP